MSPQSEDQNEARGDGGAPTQIETDTSEPVAVDEPGMELETEDQGEG